MNKVFGILLAGLALCTVLSVSTNAETVLLERFKGSIDLNPRNKSLCMSNAVEHFPAVVEQMVTTKKYGGYDKSWVSLAKQFRAAGASCISGNQTGCESGLKTIKEYSKGLYPKQKPSWQGGKSNAKYLAKYAVNTYLTSMVVDFLAIYHHRVGLTEQEIKLVDDWLMYLVREYRKAPDQRIRTHFGVNAVRDAQNHWISSASAAMSVGSWTANEKLFLAGIKQWDTTIGTIRGDGSLPSEAPRGSRAMWYTGLSIGKLMRIAETARQQGGDLYSRKSNGKSIHDAVEFYIKAIENPKIIWKYAVHNWASGGNISYKNQEVDQHSAGIWIFPYIYLFPDHKNTKRLFNLTGKESDYAKSVRIYIDSGGIKRTLQWPNKVSCFYSMLPKQYKKISSKGNYSDSQICAIAKTNGLWNNQYKEERVWVREAKYRGLDCIDSKAFEAVATSSSDKKVCDKATAPHGDARKWLADLKSDEAIFHIWREEAERRDLSCNVIND